MNDGTRPTPTKYVLDIIADDLAKAGAEFIIATGVHRGPTEEEYTFIFGKHYLRFANDVHVHDARKSDEMVYLGTSGQGTEMYINRLGYKADKILVIGSVEPHYFAGYTGGRKAFLPGIAAFSTIEKNHSHAVDKANEVFTSEISEKADIVISCAKYPMDIDLYQSQKSIENGKLALKPDGILILVASCRDGVGESAYIDLLSSCDSPEAAIKEILATYTGLGITKRQRWLKCVYGHRFGQRQNLMTTCWRISLSAR